MKILLAGMHAVPNQFTRGIQNFGCYFIHITGHARDVSVPNCDAAVIAKCQCSHEYFYKVKEAYLEAGKPLFVSDRGFGEISFAFQEWLKKVGHLDDMGRVIKRDKPKPFNSLAESLKEIQAAQEKIKPKEEPKQEEVKVQKQYKTFGEGIVRAREIIHSMVGMGAKWADISDKLNKEGIPSPRGKEWTHGTANQYAVSHGLAVRRKGKFKGSSGHVHAPHLHMPIHKTATPAPVPTKHETTEKLLEEELEEIMSSNLNSKLKLKMVRMLVSG